MTETKLKEQVLAAKSVAALRMRMHSRYGGYQNWPGWARDAEKDIARREAKRRTARAKAAIPKALMPYRQAEHGDVFMPAETCAICGSTLAWPGVQAAHIIAQTKRNRDHFGDWFIYSAANQAAVCGDRCNPEAMIPEGSEAYYAHVAAVLKYMAQDPRVPAGIVVTDPVSRRRWEIKGGKVREV